MWACAVAGDNAYSSGTDTEYQQNLFQPYQSVWASLPAWAVVGNHDALSAPASSASGPYYTAYSFPTQGESGGVASNSKLYYSFNHGNTHFVMLNSEDANR